MRVNIEIKYLLLSAVLASLKPGCVAEVCEKTLQNIAAYEGIPSSFARFNNDAIAKWSVLPSSEFLYQVDLITNDDGTVAPGFVDTYAVNETHLIIFNSTVGPQGSMKISTAGRYYLGYSNTSCLDAADFVVIRSGPEITCNASDPKTVQMSCSSVFSSYESRYIKPIMTWKNSSGATVKTEQPTPTRIDRNNPGIFLSVSQLSIAGDDTDPYECQLTFSTPMYPSDAAQNAPEFVATSIARCSLATTTLATTTEPSPATDDATTTPELSTISQVSSEPIETTTTDALNCFDQSLPHTVVYEGNTSEFRRLDNGQSVQWQFFPSSVVLVELTDITNYDDSLADEFASTYGVNGFQLTIFNSTVDPQGSDLYSTAGLYILNYLEPNCTTAANLIVIKSGPECKCDASNQTDVSLSLSCSLVFAASVIQPCRAIFKWENDNGITVSEEELWDPQNDGYVQRSQSQLPIDNDDTTTYECHVTFGAPDLGPLDYVTQAAPEFTASCSVSCEEAME